MAATDDDALVGAKPIADAAFGWEVATDLSAPVTQEEREALARVYRRDGLILFRGQTLSREQIWALVRHLEGF